MEDIENKENVRDNVMSDKFKVSYYNIFTDTLNDRRDHVLYNTRSNSTCVITHKCYNILTENALDCLPETVFSDFLEKQIIVPKEENELQTIVQENREALEEMNVLKEIIQPSANCQLGCDYCGQEHRNVTISKEVADNIIARIKNKFLKGHYKSIEVGWFGGEPLMSLQQIRYITFALKSFAEEKNVLYSSSIVTNGMSLKPAIFLELVRELGVISIEITLDGTAEYHDKHRFTKQGGESFHLIYKNLCGILGLKNFASLGCEISIRCNVDKRNEEGVSQLIKKLSNDGLQDKLRFYTASVYSWGKNDAHSLSLAKQKFAMQSILWSIELIKEGFNVLFIKPKRKKITCIAVGGDSEMYDAYGNVFNCTEVSYASVYNGTAYVLGNIKYDPFMTFENKVHHDWFNVVQNSSIYPCHYCKMLPVCGGGCPKSWVEGNPACPPFKFNIKKLMEMYYIIQTSLPSNINERLNEFGYALKVEDFERI